jgi:hypothetical protein
VPALLANQRINPMSDIKIDLSDEEILSYEVSDEALETAAETSDKVGNFTLSFCTGLSTCPA